MSDVPDLSFDQILSLAQRLPTEEQAHLIDVLLRGEIRVLSALEKRADIVELREASALLQCAGTWVGGDVEASLGTLQRMRMSEGWD